MDIEIEQLLESTRELADQHRAAGEVLYARCGGELYPCDGLAMAVLDRSLNVLEGFLLLMSNHGYLCATALLRMQLDNVLRFHGVLRSGDPHGVAAEVINGARLDKIKDRSGQPMFDRHLLTLIEEANPGITKIYEQASGYVHLSGTHVAHFLLRSAPGEDGRRIFRIGNNDDYLNAEDRRSLIRSFAKITAGVLRLIELWTDTRAAAASGEDLHRRFPDPT